MKINENFNDKVYTVIIGKPYKKLMNWLDEQGIEYKLYSHIYEPAIARNKAIMDFLDTDKQSVMMFDGDQIPIEDTKAMLFDTVEPIIYCGYPSRNVKHRGHFGDGDFASGCFRCSRELILEMQEKLKEINSKFHIDDFHFSQPLEFGWFGRAMTDFGSTETTCTCDWFRTLANSIGYTTKMVGTIGHAVNEEETLFLTDDHVSYASSKSFSSK